MAAHKKVKQVKEGIDALELSRARLEFLILNSPAVIYAAKCSDDYAATFISSNVTTQLGYQPVDFINDPSFWINHIHPDDKDDVLACLGQFFAGGHHIHVHEYRFQHKDGSYRWMHDEARTVRDGAGNPVELIGYWIDATERKKTEEALRRSEEEFRSAFEFSSVGMFQADPSSGRILRANPHFCAITGYNEAELLKRSFIDLTHPEDRERNLKEYSALGRGEIPYFRAEKRYVRKDGKPVWCEVIANMIRDSDGRPLRSTAVVRDITETKRLEEEKRRAAVLSERNRLAREVHDNLAQGLASIVLQLEGAELVLPVRAREARTHVAAARDLARRSLVEARRSLLALHSSLLDHNDLPSAMSQLVDSLELAWSSHTNLMINGRHRPLPPTTEDHLLRITQEALQNAIRHGKARKMQVELAYDKKRVSLKIQDDGNGFELAGDRRTTSLGITIMQERSAEIGARFDIQSKPGKGTRVTVEVPIPEATRAAVSR
jgi:PAS domain S-box-containing protein